MGALSLPSTRAARSRTSPGRVSERQTLPLLGLGREVLSKNAESLRNSDALMRVAVPRRRGPAGLRNLFSFLSKLRFSHSVLIWAEKSRRKRTHALRCVSAFFGAAAPLGCAASSAIWRCYCSFALRSVLSACARQGGYHHSRRALHVVETPDARLSKRLTRRFLDLTDSSLIPAAQNIVPFLHRCQKDQRDTRWSFHFCSRPLTCPDRHDKGT